MGYIGSDDNGKRRYARGMNRVQSGVWGKNIARFRSVTLTTRAGDDNSWGRMSGDFVAQCLRGIRSF